MPIVNGIWIDEFADFGLVLEKNNTLEILSEFVSSHEGCSELKIIPNLLWGQNIIYFTCFSTRFVALSAQGSPFAANAVERLYRTGVKRIIGIGTAGSTNEDIKPGTFLLPTGAVRDEGTSRGYVDISVPATPDIASLMVLKKTLELAGYLPILGNIYTTDQRYKEKPDLLKILNKRANVVGIDMETSSLLITAAYHRIPISVVKIVTDCAVKESEGDFQGVFDDPTVYSSWLNPKLEIALTAALETCEKYKNGVL